MKEQVYLKTTYLLVDKPPLLSGGYDEDELDRWISHSKNECAEGVLVWEKCNKEGEVLC